MLPGSQPLSSSPSFLPRVPCIEGMLRNTNFSGPCTGVLSRDFSFVALCCWAIRAGTLLRRRLSRNIEAVKKKRKEEKKKRRDTLTTRRTTVCTVTTSIFRNDAKRNGTGHRAPWLSLSLSLSSRECLTAVFREASILPRLVRREKKNRFIIYNPTCVYE